MTEFHVVRSVKGGSGKTTFALHTLVKLVTEGKDDNKKILYIDADVHASETRNMLLGFRREESSLGSETCFFEFYPDQFTCNAGLAREQRKQHEKHTLNSFMHPYKGFYSKISELAIPAKLKQIQRSEEVKSNPEAENTIKYGEGSRQPVFPEFIGKAFFIFADPSPSGRKVFGSLYQSYGKSAIGVGAYIAKMKSLFNYILEDKYDDVVIDMPPGSDTFSEHLMDCLLKIMGEKKRTESDKYKISIYYVLTRDKAHIRTATEAAIENLHAMRLGTADRICVVFNDGADDNSSNANNLSNADKNISNVGDNSSNNGSEKWTQNHINTILEAFRNNEDYDKHLRSVMEFELLRLNFYHLKKDDKYLKSVYERDFLLMEIPSKVLCDL